MKRFFIFSLVGIFSLSGLFALFPAYNANAASNYDEAIRTTSTLSVISEQHDFNLSLALQGDDNWYNYASQCSGFEEAYQTGAYSVSQYLNNQQAYGGSMGTGDAGVVVWYSSDPNATFEQDQFYREFSPEGTLQALNVQSSWSRVLIYHHDTNGLTVTCNKNSWFSYNFVSDNGAFFNNYLYQQSYLYQSTFFVNYPPDYEGEPLPEVPVPGVQSTIPAIGYTLFDNNKVNALSINQDISFPTTQGGYLEPKLRFSVLNTSNEVLDTKVGSLAYLYTYQLPGNDLYTLKVDYVHPGTPYAPYADNVSLGSVTFKLNANGTFQDGRNEGGDANECTIVGSVQECEEANPIEDCTVYGANLGGYFQCIFNNFGIWLRNTLIDLFIPRYSFFSGWVTTFGDFLHEKLGAVYTSFGVVGNTFNGIITSGATGKCTLAPPGQIFGASFEIDVCKFEQVAGTIVFTAVRALVIGLTILALTFALYRKYLEVVDHR